MKLSLREGTEEKERRGSGDNNAGFRVSVLRERREERRNEEVVRVEDAVKDDATAAATTLDDAIF